jgi:hypothetical protein
MLKTREVQIPGDEGGEGGVDGKGGVTIILTALPATEASEVMARLARVAGPAVAALTAALESENPSAVEVMRALPEGARALFTALTPEEFKVLREALLRDASFNDGTRTGALFQKYAAGGRLSNFDVIFSGRVLRIFPLLWEAIELNFGFSIAAKLSVFEQKAAEMWSRFGTSPARSPSSGTATDSLNQSTQP